MCVHILRILYENSIECVYVQLYYLFVCGLRFWNTDSVRVLYWNRILWTQHPAAFFSIAGVICIVKQSLYCIPFSFTRHFLQYVILLVLSVLYVRMEYSESSTDTASIPVWLSVPFTLLLLLPLLAPFIRHQLTKALHPIWSRWLKYVSWFIQFEKCISITIMKCVCIKAFDEKQKRIGSNQIASLP